MGIVRFALRYQHTFYVLALLMVFLGGSAIIATPKDVFPSINIPVVTVIWQYTGLTPEEMDQRVTTYSEYAISTSVGNIRNIESQTLSGISVEKIFFQPNFNIDLAISQIVSATNFIRALMPAGIQSPVIVQFNASSVPCNSASVPTGSMSSNCTTTASIRCVRRWRRYQVSRYPRLTVASIARSWSISTLMRFGHTASRRTTCSEPSTHRA